MSNFTKVSVAKDARTELHDKLALTGAEISVNNLPVGAGVPFVHSHKQNEEVYIILKGDGALTIDGKEVDVKEGSVVKVLPDASRTIENKGDGEFQFICVQAKAGSLEQFGLGDCELC